MDHGRYPNIKRYLLWGLMTMIILAPALYNGFPLMYSDTGTYVRSGFELLVPPDRPLMYGLFVRITSGLGTSLWGPVFVQAFLAALVIWRIWHAFFPQVKAKWFLPALLLLTVGSGLGWHGGRLLPDVFIPLALLAILDLVYGSPNRPWRLFHMGLIMLAGAVHLSTLYVLGLALVVPVIQLLHNKLPWHGVILSFSALVLSVLLTLSINLQFAGEPFVSRSGVVFLSARLIDHEHFRQWLPEYCKTRHHFLCDHLDKLPPTSQDVLWHGPLNKAGGWDPVRQESNVLVLEFLGDTENLIVFLRNSLKDVAHQLTLWGMAHEMESKWYRTEGAPPYEMVRRFFPRSMPAFLAARQNGGRGELSLRWPDRLHHLLLALGLTVLLLAILRPSLLHPDTTDQWIAIFTITAVVFGTAFCATVSIPLERYLARMSWIIPLMSFGLGLRSFVTDR